MNEPKFIFQFEHKGEIQPLYFGNPDEIIICTTFDEVIPAINKIQAAVKNGYYAGGFISYEAAPAFEQANIVNDKPKMPLLWFGLFKEPLSNTYTSNERKGKFRVSTWMPSITYDTYKENIQRIKDAICNGETYQVNYTMKLRAHFEGEPRSFYNFLNEKQNASYSAFLDIGRFKILSVSPELFFNWNNHKIITKPMKGTVKRGEFLQEDLDNANWLRNSSKNQAENLMIVDLLRNDLGQIAVPGTVKVPKLFEIEKYPTVFQMTSTVTAITRQDVQLVDILKSLFPCGSITGAPKINTMRYINLLEEEPREVYCGTVGLIKPSGDAIFNVAIRTVLIDEDSGIAEYSVGGGVTWDSTSDDEYSEALTKAALLTENSTTHFQLIETIRLENGNYLLLDEHLNRLLSSAKYFNFKVNQSEVQNKLTTLAKHYYRGIYRICLFISQKGEILVEAHPFDTLNKSQIYFSVAKEAVNSNERFLYHQTTNRSVYDLHKNQNKDVFDVLLWNEYGQLTQFTTGNVVAEIDGILWTPPEKCGLLAGVLRNSLIAQNKIKERILTLDDIPKVNKFYYLNSLQGMREINYTVIEKERVEI